MLLNPITMNILTNQKLSVVKKIIFIYIACIAHTQSCKLVMC